MPHKLDTPLIREHAAELLMASSIGYALLLTLPLEMRERIEPELQRICRAIAKAIGSTPEKVEDAYRGKVAPQVLAIIKSG